MFIKNFLLLILICISFEAHSQGMCVNLFTPKTQFKPYQLSLENGEHKILGIRFGNLDKLPPKGVELLLADIKRILKTDPEVKILVEAKANLMYERWHRKLPNDLQKRIQKIDLSTEDVWARDYSKPLMSEKPSILVPSFRYVEDLNIRDATGNLTVLLDRNDFLNRIKDVFSKYGVTVERTELPFEGGDFVVGSRHVFIGIQTIRNAAVLFKISEVMALRLYERVFGKKVFVLRKTKSNSKNQTLEYHADLVLAVVKNKKTGKDVILLNSNRLFMEIALGRDFPARLVGENEQTIKFIEDFQKTRTDAKSNDVDDSMSLMRHYLKPETLIEDIQQVENLRIRLEGEGYEVIEVPGFKLYSAPHQIESLRFINYTNSVIGDQFALVPYYGIREMDSYVNQIFSDLGYDVIKMESAMESQKLSGGPRCMCEAYYDSNVASTP